MVIRVRIKIDNPPISYNYEITSQTAITVKQAIQERDMGNGLLECDDEQVIPIRSITHIEENWSYRVERGAQQEWQDWYDKNNKDKE